MFTVFRKSKDTFSKSIFPRRYRTPNVSFHTKEFFRGTDPDYVPDPIVNRIEKAPDFNIQNFNFSNFRVDIETPLP